jgi:hypothetical protein
MQNRRKFLCQSAAWVTMAAALQACGGDDSGGGSLLPTPSPSPTPAPNGEAISLRSDLTVADFTARPADSFQLNGFTLTIERITDTLRTAIFLGDGAVVIKSGFARPEWWSTPSYRRAATAVMNGGGGRVLFQAARYKSESSVPDPLLLSNVQFEGVGQPGYADNNTTLSGGTILEGPVMFGVRKPDGTVIGDNVSIRNLGVDSGSKVAAGRDLEGLLIPNFGQVPETAATRLRTGIVIENVTVLCASPTTPVHAILVEQAQGPLIRNVSTMFGIHGVAVKTRGALIDTAIMRGHATNCWIDKSDGYSISANNTWRNLNMGSVTPGDTFGGRIYCGSAPNSGHTVEGVYGRDTVGLVSIEPNGYSIINTKISDVNGDDVRRFAVRLDAGSADIELSKLRIAGVSDVIDGSYGAAIRIANDAARIKITNLQCSNTAGDGIRNSGTNVSVFDSTAATPGPGYVGFNGVDGSMTLTRCVGTVSGAVIVA